MHSIESVLVIGPSNILSAGMYVCTFQPGNFTGCEGKGVNEEAFECVLDKALSVDVFTSS